MTHTEEEEAQDEVQLDGYQAGLDYLNFTGTGSDPSETPDEEGRYFIPADTAQDLGLIDEDAALPTDQAGYQAGLDYLQGLSGGGIADPLVISGVYSPIPLSQLQLDIAVDRLLGELAFVDNDHPFVKADILTKVRAMEMVPEVAHILANPDIIDDWQMAVWPLVLDAMVNGESDNTTHLGVFTDKDIQDDEHMKSWATKFGAHFSSDELGFVYQLIAATPTYQDLLDTAVQEGRVTTHDNRGVNIFNRAWNNIQTGLAVMFQAPEVFSARAGSPRGNILTQSALYLSNHNIESVDDRDKFFTWLIRLTNEEAKRFDRLEGGFDKLVTRSVAVPVVASKMLYKEFALSFADPEDYMWRQGLTMGQSLAVQVGINPGDEYTWDLFTGTADAIQDIGFDPLTWAGGLGAGFRNVRQVVRPANMTRMQAIKYVFNPKTSSKLEFGLFDRGMIPRMYWGFMSKQADEFSNTKAAWKVWNWMAQSGNQSADILVRYPSLHNIPENELKRLAAEKNPEAVRDLFRGWLSNAPQPGANTPSIDEKEMQAFFAARSKYVTAQKSALDSGEANIRGLVASTDGVHPNQVFEVVTMEEAVEGGVGVYRATEFTGSGAPRTVISTVARGPVIPGDLNVPSKFDDLISWLTQDGMVSGALELATELRMGVPFSELTQAQRVLLQRYALAADVDSLVLDGFSIFGKNVDDLMRHGFDDEVAKTVESVRQVETAAMATADREIQRLRLKSNVDAYFIIDIPIRRLTSKIQDAAYRLGKGGHRRYQVGMRRTGFQMAHALPSNISLSHGARGGAALRNWIKALGGGEELARKWMQTFLEGTVTTREKIVRNAFEAVGETIDNPQLREGLVQFYNKQGQRTFLGNRVGIELGLTDEGSILPTTITHLTNEMAMPEPKSLIKAVRRFKRNATTPLHRQGFLKGTKDRRNKIVQRLQADALARGIPRDSLTKDEWLAVGYADVLTQITGRSRADVMGAVNAIGSTAYSAFRTLHNTFTLGQLAFRPLAWSGRVLIEEGIRAELVGLPSLWSNPTRFIAGIMDARAISKLTSDARGQARVMDSLVEAKLFYGGTPNHAGIRAVFPDIAERLKASNVDPKNFGRYKSFIAHELGKSLTGGEATTNARIGSRLNWARRTLLRSRRQNRAHRALDEAGLLESFRFQEDAQQITNRSFASDYITEIGTGYKNMTYTAGAMGPDSLNQYGRGWGRTVFQMFGDDPLVRNYGLPRMVANVTGNPSGMDATTLLADPSWQKQLPIIRRLLRENGLEGKLNPLEEAEWYLTNIVDEIAHTYLADLADGDMARKAEIAQALFDRDPITLEFGDGVAHTIDLSRDNYEGVAQTFVEIAHSRNSLGLSAPVTVNAVIDPRFGQKRMERRWYRKAVDWIMQKAGEDATQALHRRPSYLAIHKTYYHHALALGATPDQARHIADEKAVEIVNYIYFNNKDIPQFLKDMNKVIPFFSAMYEVSQTWLYKIPAHTGWPIGAAHLLRKVDRTLDALHNVGILTTDEDGQMSVRADPKATTGSFSWGLAALTRAPLYLAEHLVGIGRLALEPFDADGVRIEPYKPADLGAWTKDGFTLAIGNPLDPRSHGIMAVNQLSVGPTPALSYPLGLLTERFASVDSQRVNTDGLTLGEYAVKYPDQELAEVLYLNRDALEVVNTKENVARAFDDGDPSALLMPDFIVVPKSSLWETIMDEVVFPFGKMDSFGQVFTSPSPAALNHVWRSVFTAFDNPDSEMMGFFFGQMSNYQMTGEVIYAMQHLEAEEGLATEISALTLELVTMIHDTDLEVREMPDELPVILSDPDHPGYDDFIELRDKIRRKETSYLTQAHNNAAGSSFMRGLTGSLLPATPRFFDWQQEEASAYWDQRNLAEEAKIKGSSNYADLLATMPQPTGKNLVQALNVVTAYMNDPSGSEAKQWVRKNNPSMEPFLKGKSFWDGGVPPPEALEIDQWVDDMKAGRRQTFDPEVWLARYQRAAVAIDKEVAIINLYGNDPNVAAQRILMDYDKYKDLIDEYDMAFAAQEYLDDFLYEGKYAAWRRQVTDQNVSLLSEVHDKVRFMQESVDAIADMLEYMNLSPEEERRIRGMLTSGVRELGEAIDELRRRDTEDQPWLGNRDRVLANYWTEVASPYYEGRTAIFEEQVNRAKNSRERSIAFDNLRRYDNEHYRTRQVVEGYGGETVEVPSEMLRSWNTKTGEEKTERILAIMDKKPEWLNAFQIDTLLAVAPQLADVLPITDEDWEIYESFNEKVRSLQDWHQSDPLAVPESVIEKEIADMKEARDEWLLQNGRAGEVVWREQYVPAQRLEYAGLLPTPLLGMIPQLNTLLDTLRAEEKSPTSNAGESLFLLFVRWLVNDYFVQVPNAEEVMADLGLAMFNEGLQSAVFARLLQGDRFGKLE